MPMQSVIQSENRQWDFQNNSTGHGCHGICVDIRMQKKILWKKHNKQAKQPAGYFIRKKQRSQFSYIDCHDDTEQDVDEAGAKKQSEIVCSERR